jgi:hypothetical protein
MIDRRDSRYAWMVLGASAFLFASAWYIRSPALCLLAVGLASFTMASVASRLRGPLVSCGSVALCLALLEIVAASSGVGDESSAGELYYDPGYRVRVSDLGPLGSPGEHVSRRRSTTGELIYEVTYSVGPEGFRVTPGAPADASLEVNFFGCSFTLGEGVEDDQTFPAYVQSALPGSSARNFGFHGYGVHQSLAILTSERNTDGDVNFLLSGPWHAPRSACVPEWTVGHPKYRLTADGGVERAGSCEQTLSVRLINHSALARALDLDRFLAPPQDEQIELYLALVAEIARISRARGQAFAIGYLRAGDDWFRGTFDDERVLERLGGLGIPTRDMTLGKAAFDLSPEYQLHAEDPHPSPRAHRERAAIAAQLIASVAEQRALAARSRAAASTEP